MKTKPIKVQIFVAGGGIQQIKSNGQNIKIEVFDKDISYNADSKFEKSKLPIVFG